VVTKVVGQLREYGETRRGWLGVRIQDVTEDMAEAMGLEKTGGALISDVPEGPAKEAGLKAGDVIVSFDGAEVRDTRDLVRRVGESEVGKSVRVLVFRDGGTQTILVTLGRREDAERAGSGSEEEGEGGQTTPEASKKEFLGLTVSVLTAEMRAELGLAEDATGLAIVAVDEASEAFEKGLRTGDVITEAGQQKVATLADLETRIDEAREAGRKSLLLLVRRGGEPRFVALSLGQ